MSWLQVVVLSIVQGLTEFLPVSSSGHLVILQKFFGLATPPMLFDILVHVGTLGAVVIFFKKELERVIRGKEGEGRVLWLVVTGTIPAAVVGGFFYKQLEQAFNSFQIVGFSFLLTSILLFSTRLIKVGNKQFSGEAGSGFARTQLNWSDALFVGILQAIAILPGVSRSGSTIVAGLWRGASQETAFRFSFYLAIPAILGALFLKSGELFSSPSDNLIQGLAGMILAGIIGYFALGFLEKILKSAKLFWFGFYCLVLGLTVLLI